MEKLVEQLVQKLNSCSNPQDSNILKWIKEQTVQYPEFKNIAAALIYSKTKLKEHIMHDKKAYQSKKFIAFFFACCLLGGILVTALVLQTFNIAMAAFMSVGMIALAVLTIGYILSQKEVDMFIKGIGSLKGNKNESTDEKTVE